MYQNHFYDTYNLNCQQKILNLFLKFNQNLSFVYHAIILWIQFLMYGFLNFLCVFEVCAILPSIARI